MTTTTLYLRDRGIDVEVTGHVTPEIPSYYARDPGCWMPPEGGEVEDVEVRPIPDGEEPALPLSLEFDGLTQQDQDRILDALVDAASEDGESYHYERGERQSDARREH